MIRVDLKKETNKQKKSGTINETKSWFCKQINKKDKLLSRFTKKKEDSVSEMEEKMLPQNTKEQGRLL